MISIFSVFILNLDLPQAQLVAVLLVIRQVGGREVLVECDVVSGSYKCGKCNTASARSPSYAISIFVLVEYSHLSQLYLQGLVGNLNLNLLSL